MLLCVGHGKFSDGDPNEFFPIEDLRRERARFVLLVSIQFHLGNQQEEPRNRILSRRKTLKSANSGNS
jgi:hypothetical protein